MTNSLLPGILKIILLPRDGERGQSPCSMKECHRVKVYFIRPHKQTTSSAMLKSSYF